MYVCMLYKSKKEFIYITVYWKENLCIYIYICIIVMYIINNVLERKKKRSDYCYYHHDTGGEIVVVVGVVGGGFVDVHHWD